MKYKMMKNVGALQDCDNRKAAVEDETNTFENYADMHESSCDLPIYSQMYSSSVSVEPEKANRQIPESALEMSMLMEKRTMFYYTVPEGKRVLVTDKYGKSEIIVGPKRIRRRGKTFQSLSHYIAYPGEFLIVRFRDGSQKHLPGPVEVWFDPRIHAKIEKSDSLQISSQELIVVYSEENNETKRRIVNGPTVFVPNPGEWLHTFKWHGNKGGGYKKVPGGLVFQKLWLMPDQMYHDVEDVRTADDVVLTIKLMLFFELVEVEKMLEETHDPIGDFINATSSDVIELVGRYSFDQFKLHTDKLNKLETYAQLQGRASQVGYKIHKIVYRGYSTTNALQAMHEKAIETRTRLKLERETEEQAQLLADFKQKCELERKIKTRDEEKEHEKHELEKKNLRHKQEMEVFQKQFEVENEQWLKKTEQKRVYKQNKNNDWVSLLEHLAKMNVDLTQYLTQGRADKLIELRGNTTNPHIHLDEAEK